MSRVEFGADGIRGKAGEWPFVTAGAVRLGHALGRFVRARSQDPCAVIGRDTRPSGVSLLPCLVAGLADEGVNVIDLGVMTTPGVAFLTRQQQADLGVIVSASHSPHDYSGIKLVREKGLRLQREDELEVEGLIEELMTSPLHGTTPVGQETQAHHLKELYIQDHVKRCPVPSLKGFSVVLDCANGAVSGFAPEAFRQLDATVHAINDEAEGNSINYQCGSEHVRDHPQDLAQIVRHHEAAYGFAFDGDGDRLIVVDSEGRVFDGDDILFVLATCFHTKNLLRHASVVTTRLANRGLEEALQAAGIRTVYTGSGDKNLEAAIWGSDYLLGGEPGGNVLINDGHHTAADAIYAAVVLAGVLVSGPNLSLGDMLSPLQKRAQDTRSFRLSRALTLGEKARLRQKLSLCQGELSKGGRILAWDSTTEPGVFRVMVEGGRGDRATDVSLALDLARQLVHEATELTGQGAAVSDPQTSSADWTGEA
jgi:phosphoglucosamine mutase